MAHVEVLKFEVGQKHFIKTLDTIPNKKEIAFSRTFLIFKE